MSVHNRWLIPDEIILSETSGMYTRNDLRQNSEEIPALAEQSPHEHVMLLFDCTQMTGIRFSPREATHSLTFLKDDRYPKAAICGVSRPLQPISNVLGTVISSAMRTQIRFFNEQDQGVDWLQTPEPKPVEKPTP